MIRFFTSALSVATALTATTSFAQFPDRQINYIIPFVPGGESDIAARLQGKVAAKLTGKDFVVQNKAGAGGALAWGQLNSMPGDGYTVVGSNLPHLILQPLEGQVQYKTEDITSVFFFHYTPDALVVALDSPYKTFADLVNAAKATCDVSAGTPSGTDNGTTYLSAVDKEGNMISLIQSNYSTVGFGAGITVADAGFVWHNRGAGFSFDPASANVLAGRKRPLHTIIPAFMEKGDTRVAFGIMGGWNQAQAHAQFVSNIADFGMNIQGALDAPRFSKETFPGCDVNFESRIADGVLKALAAMGHEIVMRGDYSSTRMGAGQAVMRNYSTGINAGASDPRKDGSAVSELLPVRSRTPAAKH